MQVKAMDAKRVRDVFVEEGTSFAFALTVSATKLIHKLLISFMKKN